MDLVVLNSPRMVGQGDVGHSLEDMQGQGHVGGCILNVRVQYGYVTLALKTHLINGVQLSKGSIPPSITQKYPIAIGLHW